MPAALTAAWNKATGTPPAGGIRSSGGVLGPVAVFVVLLEIQKASGNFSEEIDAIAKLTNPATGQPMDPLTQLFRGWGIPTATDISLAWMVAILVFGVGHTAIDFLLLLAIADDGIGLIIIACRIMIILIIIITPNFVHRRG